MTTEDDFQAMLDADPSDHTTRLVFADWLQERGDERAEGYRALGRLQLRARAIGDVFYWYDLRVFGVEGYADQTSNLPHDWFRALWTGADSFCTYRGRKLSDERAVKAFLKLPFNRRQQLLLQES